MEIVRIYNNNVIVTIERETGEEMIAIGKGLAFQKKAGDDIDEDKIEKIFMLKDKEVMSKLEKLIYDIPTIYLTIAEEIIESIHRESELEVSENIYVALTDHISSSVEREKSGIVCQNPLLLEIKQFYKTEFRLAKKAADIIYKHTQVMVSEDEMGFIALHIVNASMNQRAKSTVENIKLIKEIIEIVTEFLGGKMDENSLYFDRFLRHLQFFARRILTVDCGQEENEFLFHLGLEQYPEIVECVEKIKHLIKNQYGKEMTKAEQGYLLYHLKLLETAKKDNKL